MQGIELRAGDLGDEQNVRSLLARCDLPHEDIRRHLPQFLIARLDGVVVATGGLEILGGGLGLLRSLAVAPEWRQRGLASVLCDALTDRAARIGVDELWLLTTTAERFFARIGFRTVPRSLCPPDVRQTEEFRNLCPATAVCMARRIVDGTKPVRSHGDPCPLPGSTAQ